MQRRTFISTAGAAGLGFGATLRSSHAQSPPTLLALLENSARERLIPELVARIRSGTSPQELLASLSVAAARNVQPVPQVGFKYHALMMLWSADEATKHLTAADRWLPLLWAADYFKQTQEEERSASGWRQSPPVATASSASVARMALIAALDRWDPAAADAALVAWLQVIPAADVFPLLFRYGARDLRDIGHKAIAVANVHRLAVRLDSQQLESVLRSTVAAIQNPDSTQNPATADLDADRPFRRNVQLLKSIPPSWQQGRDDGGARSEFRSVLYQVAPEEAGTATVAQLQKGIAPESLWRVLFNTAAELILVHPDVVSLHAQTTANALHYAYRACADESTQQLLLLQCAAFIALFRAMTGVSAKDCHLEALQPLAFDPAGERVFAELAPELAVGDRLTASRRLLGYLQRHGDAKAVMAWVRKNVAYGADDPHDFKYPEAVFENYLTISDFDWRCRCLSAGMGLYKLPPQRPNPVATQVTQLLPT